MRPLIAKEYASRSRPPNMKCIRNTGLFTDSYSRPLFGIGPGSIWVELHHTRPRANVPMPAAH